MTASDTAPIAPRLMSWARIFQVRQQMRQSLWVVPFVGAFFGFVLARIDLWGESRIDLPAAWSFSAATATGLLSAVAGAMVGLIGLVVTIGVLVVQMATGTLSPRFMRMWYRDRVQKLTLASFTATFVFAYALLPQVSDQSVPDLGVVMAGVAVTLDLFLLLVYLDRFVHALRPVAVGAAMASAGLTVVTGLREDEWRGPGAGDLSAPDGRADREPSLRVRARDPGAIQAVNVKGIVRFASRRDLTCAMPNTVGDFVTAGGVLFEVYGETSRWDAIHLRGQVALGKERTIDQDPAFALRIMVDIAIRALSPAVNDPTTATQMLDHIGTVLLGLGTGQPGERAVRVDGSGSVRLSVPTRSWDDYLTLGVTEIRCYGVTSPQTCRRLHALLIDLEAEVAPVNRPAVRHQLKILDAAVSRAFDDEEDRTFARSADRQGIGSTSTGAGADCP
jgi:uncharacterized membrane protein